MAWWDGFNSKRIILRDKRIFKLVLCFWFNRGDYFGTELCIVFVWSFIADGNKYLQMYTQYSGFFDAINLLLNFPGDKKFITTETRTLFHSTLFYSPQKFSYMNEKCRLQSTITLNQFNRHMKWFRLISLKILPCKANMYNVFLLGLYPRNKNWIQKHEETRTSLGLVGLRMQYKRKCWALLQGML